MARLNRKRFDRHAEQLRVRIKAGEGEPIGEVRMWRLSAGEPPVIELEVFAVIYRLSDAVACVEEHRGWRWRWRETRLGHTTEMLSNQYFSNPGLADLDLAKALREAWPDIARDIVNGDLFGTEAA